MNPLKDDKAPYALALLFGAFGWHVSQITEEIKQASTVSYSVYQFDDIDTQVVRLENLSDDKYISSLRFEFACLEDEKCFAEDSIEARDDGPVMIELDPVVMDREAVINLYLPPSAAIFVIQRRIRDTKFPILKYSPGREAKEGIFYVSGKSWRVLITKNYLSLIALSLIMITLIIFSTLLSIMFGEAKTGGTVTVE
jgi:hypothetical protein